MKKAEDILASKVTINNEFGLESSLPHILDAMEEYAKQYKRQRNLLNEKTKDDILIEILEPIGAEIKCPTGKYSDLFAYLYNEIYPLINQRHIGIENFIRNKLQETEEMQEYSVSTDTIRCWIDEYNNRA